MDQFSMSASGLPAPPGATRRPRLAALFVTGALAFAAVLSTGCSKSFIPNTDVPDTAENRKVILFCEQYRHAVEEKNVAQLLKLASPNYHKRGAVDDDVDYGTLKDFLT